MTAGANRRVRQGRRGDSEAAAATTLYLIGLVMLPSSTRVVDGSSIIRHVLRHGSDPFSRTPLALEDLTTDEQLRRQILHLLASPSLRSISFSPLTNSSILVDAEAAPAQSAQSTRAGSRT